MAIKSSQQLGLSGVDRDNSLLKVQGVKAVGGTVTQITDYTIHTFTSTGNSTLQVLEESLIVEYLIVGGGGGGNGFGGGGGGGGGFLSGTKTLSKGSHTITVGAGGTAGNTSNATSGSSSTAFGLTAYGGGLSGNDAIANGGNGGSGGGAGTLAAGTGVGGSARLGQGNKGGAQDNQLERGGGGGGAGSEGQIATTNATRAGDGGAGKISTISGASVYYAGGGGGGNRSSTGSPAYTSRSGGNGGSGGGGKGSDSSTNNPVAGTANTGGGGGGGRGYTSNEIGAAGGSGIVIIRYKKTNTTNTIVTDSLLFNADATAGAGGIIGTSWTDASGNGYTGTLVGTPSYDVTDGGALLFDGSGSLYATIPDSAHGYNITIEAWIHPTKIGGTSGAILKKNTENDYWPAMALIIDTNGALVGMYTSETYGAGYRSATTANNTIALNTWYHVVFSKGAAGHTSMKIYINAVSESYTSFLYGGDINQVANSTKPYHIGIDFDTPNYVSKFKGKIAIVRVYSKQLSDAEVLQNFNAGRENYGL
jgi:hypothetical protein